MTLLEDEEGNCHLRNLSMHLVGSEEEALNLLFLGDTNRAISATAMNQVRVCLGVVSVVALALLHPIHVLPASV